MAAAAAAPPSVAEAAAAAVVDDDDALGSLRVCGLGFSTRDNQELSTVHLWSGNEHDDVLVVEFSELLAFQIVTFVDDFARVTAGRVVVSTTIAPHLLVCAFVEPLAVLAPKTKPGRESILTLSHRLAVLLGKTPVGDACVNVDCEHVCDNTVCRERQIQDAVRYEIASTLKGGGDDAAASGSARMLLADDPGEVSFVAFSPWRGYESGVTLYRKDGSVMGQAATRSGNFGEQLWHFLLTWESKVPDFRVAFFVEYEHRLLFNRLSLALHVASTSFFTTRSDSPQATWERRPRYLKSCVDTSGNKYVSNPVTARNAALFLGTFPQTCLRAAGVL